MQELLRNLFEPLSDRTALLDDRGFLFSKFYKMIKVSINEAMPNDMMYITTDVYFVPTNIEMISFKKSKMEMVKDYVSIKFNSGNVLNISAEAFEEIKHLVIWVDGLRYTDKF